MEGSHCNEQLHCKSNGIRVVTKPHKTLQQESFVKGHRLVAESLVVFSIFNQRTPSKILICLTLVTLRLLLK